jgi:photosystem II stability/assembly factor-like uncharacterized protein
MSLAVAAEAVYAGTNFGGVLKSVDGGASWRLANRGLPSVPYLRARVFEPIVALLLDRRRPGTVYAAMAATGVFVSRDGAAHWRRLAPGLAEPRVESLALVGGTLYAATGGGVFKSTGGAWRRAGLRGRWLEAIATDSRRPSTVYAGALHGGVYASRDGGESWNPANDGLRNLYVRTLLADPRTPGRIYAGTYGGVFTSGNGGRTWSELNDGLANRLVQALAIGSGRSASLYAGTLGGGVFAIEQRRSR